MAKRSQQDSGEERVTAKSRPMNLVATTPSLVSSSTSTSAGKRSYGSQNPWSSISKEVRLERPDKGTDLFEASDLHYHEQFMESFSSASCSKLDDDRAWSSQETLDSYLCMQENLVKDNGHSLVLVPKRSGIL